MPTKYAEDVKKTAIEMYKNGDKIKAIAESVKCGRSAVRRWVKGLPKPAKKE